MQDGAVSEARDAFEAMIRYELGPLLREGGLSGTHREFRLREGEYEGAIAVEGWAKANRGETYTFDFRIELRDRLTKKWLRELPRLSNLAVADSNWTVVPGEPTLALAPGAGTSHPAVRRNRGSDGDLVSGYARVAERVQEDVS